MIGSWISVWSAVHNQSGLQRSMSQQGLMEEGGGGGCYCNEEGVPISDFQMLAGMKW